MKPRLLDLFSGAGGCARGYQRAGFWVVGVDNRPQPRYCGDAFVQADALEVMDRLLAGGSLAEFGGPDLRLGDFAAIHASPPCQAHSSMTAVTGTPNDHPDLIEPTRAHLLAAGLHYVIENVERAPLREPVTLCGLAVGLAIVDDGKRWHLRRHRLFESSVALLVPPCACHRSRDSGSVLGVYGGGTRQASRKEAASYNGGCTDKANAGQARRLMDMPWATRDEMNQAIPPAYTELIGHQLMQHVTRAAA